MLRLILAAALSTALLLGCSAAETETTAETALAQTLDQQLAAILQVLPGKYKAENPRAVPPKGEMEILYHKFVPIDAPQFGDTVLYYQLSTGSADGAALQMKIFSFDDEPARAVNRMRAHVFAPGQAPGNLDQAPERLAALEPSELMSFPTQCDLIWSPEGSGFIGAVRAADCAFPGGVFKQTIRPAMSYNIAGNRLEWDEILYTDDMRVLVTTNGALLAIRQ